MHLSKFLFLAPVLVTVNFISLNKLAANDTAVLSSMAKPSSSVLAQAASSSKDEVKIAPTLSIKKSSVAQGQFFDVEISDVDKNPLVWFNSESFLSFKVADKTYRALVPVENLTKPGAYAIKAKSGDWEEKIPVTVLDNKKAVQKIYLDPDKSSLEPTSKEISEIAYALKTKTEERYAKAKFIYPSSAAKSSPFGVKRSYNNGPVDSYHKGLDFAGNMGSPVFAPADGKVLLTGYEKDGYQVHGNTILIDHGHAISSIYLHLSKIDVKKGDIVTKGQKIGEVGHTGISTGPHLHWGTYLYGTSVDPELFVKGDFL